jgi:hypothetical protein
MVSFLTLLKVKQGAGWLRQQRKEALMGKQSCDSAFLETLWAMGTSFAAGCLPT